MKKVASVATLGLSDAVLSTPEAVGSTQAAVAAPDTTPTAVSEGTLEAREAQRRRQLAAAGLSGTNLTGGGLTTAANTGAKTLLGS
ncbi:hypothetical protein D3C84_1080130 [compost metagenome]